MKARGWKKAETRFARDVGTERKPCDGSRAGADFDDGLCVYQLKVRRMLPTWLWNWLAGIQWRADHSNRIGVLVVKQPRDLDEQAIVMLSWADWVALHGDARKRAADEQKTIEEKNQRAIEAIGIVKKAAREAFRP